MLRTWIRAAAATAALLVALTAAAAAEPYVTITQCDSVSIGGVFYPRVTFQISNLYPNEGIGLVSGLPVTPASPEDTCRAVSVTAPVGWRAYATNDNGVLWADLSETGSGQIAPGQTLGGFQIVLSQHHSCCWDLNFDGFFEPFHYERVCFHSDAPVPVLRRSWGAVKQLYR